MKAIIVALALSTSLSVAIKPKAIEVPAPQVLLKGMWKLVQNEEGAPAAIADRTMTKFFSASHWNTTHRDKKTGVVSIHTGGSYKIEGDIVSETIDYSLPNTKHLIGETNRFKAKMVDGKLHFKGLDRGWDEIWERVE